MGCPCELLCETDDGDLADRLVTLPRDEALRIDRKFSRYRTDSVVHAIITSRGAPLQWIPKPGA